MVVVTEKQRECSVGMRRDRGCARVLKSRRCYGSDREGAAMMWASCGDEIE